MKPSNCASAIGFMPCAARPTVRPAMVVSSSGVSNTRHSPNFSDRPCVARNTPPLTPTSSPSTTTDGSRFISYASACVTPSIKVICAMSVTSLFQCLRLGPLRRQIRRQFGEGVIEHRSDRLRAGFQVGIHLVVHPIAAFGLPSVFLFLVPRFLRFEPGAQADR